MISVGGVETKLLSCNFGFIPCASSRSSTGWRTVKNLSQSAAVCMFVKLLTLARTRQIPDILQTSMTSAFMTRWAATFSQKAMKGFAASLLAVEKPFATTLLALVVTDLRMSPPRSHVTLNTSLHQPTPLPKRLTKKTNSSRTWVILGQPHLRKFCDDLRPGTSSNPVNKI